MINQVNDISNTIASAVEEQTVTTNEIGRNVAEAAKRDQRHRQEYQRRGASRAEHYAGSQRLSKGLVFFGRHGGATTGDRRKVPAVELTGTGDHVASERENRMRAPSKRVRASRTNALLWTAGITMMMFLPAPAPAQIVVKNEDVTFKLGVQGQLWGDWTQDSSGTQGYQQNFYLRRVRLIMGGDIGKDISFFLKPTTPSLVLRQRTCPPGLSFRTR